MPLNGPDERPVLAYVGNDASYFVSHRLSVANAAIAAGYAVHAILPGPVPAEIREHLSGSGLVLHEMPFDRGGMHPVQEMRSVLALWRYLRGVKPVMVHNLTVKPVLYSGVVSRLLGIPSRVHALLGLGYLFFDDSMRARTIRWLLRPAFRFALGGNGSRILVQNPDDLTTLERRYIIDSEQARRAVIIPGSGADPSDYSARAAPQEPPIVLFAGRLTAAKGVQTFIDAARAIRNARADVRFVVCGGIDVSNPGHVTAEQMDTWVRDGVVEWWGHQADMVAVLEAASIVVLPSVFGEGIPKILIEAAAASRPIVTTDTPGCREIVNDGDNGRLVPAQEPVALAGAIEDLLNDAPKRRRMGAAGRTRVEEGFSTGRVIEKTLAVYRDMAGR